MDKTQARAQTGEVRGNLPAQTTPDSPGSQYNRRRVRPLAEQAGDDKTTAVRRQVPSQQASGDRSAETQIPVFAREPDLSSPQLPINVQAKHWLAPEQLLQLPPSTPTLEKDEALTDTLQEVGSLSLVEKHLAERRRVEQQQQEFKLDLMMPCLRNMRTFISHIAQQKQFAAPLTAGEEKAIAWLAEKTQELLDAGAPYKRTVHLAIALMSVYEIITARQVLGPLLVIDPLKDKAAEQERLSRFARALGPHVDPVRVMECCWGGNNPGGRDEAEHFAENDLDNYTFQLTLSRLVNDNRLFVFPSFQSLDLLDFCRFGHLPVHVIGMTTAYATNADGLMMSPLQFAIHDMLHMYVQQDVGAVENPALSQAASVLLSPGRRLQLRCLLLDQLPASLTPLNIKTALILLLFEFFHENAPCVGARGLDYSRAAFIYCLSHLAEARRSLRSGYAKSVQAVTDTEAARATLWALSLWELWRTADFKPLTPEQLETRAQAFEKTDLPRLDRHLDFLEQHRAALRQLFAERYCRRHQRNDQSIRFQIDCSAFPKRDGYDLFITWDSFSGLYNLDNTDLVYFHALELPRLREDMENATGAILPDAPLCEPERPVPDSAASPQEPCTAS